MKGIKIIGQNEENYKYSFAKVMNIACVISMSGNIPTEREMADPGGSGRYWYREGNRVHLFGAANNHWASVFFEDETSCIVAFNFRNSDGTLEEAIYNLLETMSSFFLKIERVEI